MRSASRAPHSAHARRLSLLDARWLFAGDVCLRLDRTRDPFLEPGMFAAKHLLRHAVDRRIVLTVEPVEEGVDPNARFAAKQIRQRYGLGVSLLRKHLCANARRCDREQLRPDVDGAEEHHLLPLETWPESYHCMEERASQLIGAALGKAQMLGERSKLAVARGMR